MYEIPPPRSEPGIVNHRTNCRFAIEPVFNDLVRAALVAGWSEEDIAAALLELSVAAIGGLAPRHWTEAHQQSLVLLTEALKRRL